jgi:hypothetical protein
MNKKARPYKKENGTTLIFEKMAIDFKGVFQI